jgi:hypothetical protein
MKKLLILLIFLTTFAFADDNKVNPYSLARKHIEAEEYELASKILEADNPKFEVETKLFRAYCLVKISETTSDIENLNKAKVILRELIDNYPSDGSERHRELAIWFMRELKGAGSGPLLEISKSMKAISRLIRKKETGKQTQQSQDKVLKSLQKLIDMMEEKGKGGKGQGKCPKCKGKGCKHCQKESKQKSQGKSGKPMEDSKLPGGSSKVGKLKRDAKRGTKEGWGSLKPKERAKVLDVLKERFPEQYRDIIEQYYKSLNSRKKYYRKD